MSDDRSQTEPDRKVINLSNLDEARERTNGLGVTQDILREANAAFALSADTVREYLLSH